MYTDEDRPEPGDLVRWEAWNGWRYGIVYETHDDPLTVTVADQIGGLVPMLVSDLDQWCVARHPMHGKQYWR
jgi:hypothetical protein